MFKTFLRFYQVTYYETIKKLSPISKSAFQHIIVTIFKIFLNWPSVES